MIARLGRRAIHSAKLIGDEDCLSLNVWTSAEPATEPRPVMVYLHGGDNRYGYSGEFDFYDGRYLTTHAGVVLVTLIAEL